MSEVIRLPVRAWRTDRRADTARMLRRALRFLEEDARRANLPLVADLLGAASLSASDELRESRGGAPGPANDDRAGD